MRTVVGVFDTIAQAKDAATDLENAGFAEDNLGILTRNGPEVAEQESPKSDAEAGAAIGGITGFLMGIGSFVVPGFGVVAATGWVVSIIAGAVIGAGAGGLIGALKRAGAPEDSAADYADAVRGGATLLLVNADENESEGAARIMREAGATRIDDHVTPSTDRPHLANATQWSEGLVGLEHVSHGEHGEHSQPTNVDRSNDAVQR